MKTDTLDLNLLKVLAVLLEERSVTRTAKRVGLSQSATSHALERLRIALGDPLFVRVGRTLSPTARALEMSEPLSQALLDLGSAVSGRPAFDPKTTNRRFRVATSDYAEFLLIPSLIERLQDLAPGVDIAVQPLGSMEDVRSLAADVAIGLRPKNSPLSGVRSRALFQEDFACLLRRKHPALKRPWTADGFSKELHVMIAPGGTPGGIVDTALSELGLSRRVVAQVPHFLVAPFLVLETDLVVTLPSRVAHAFARYLPLEVVAPPISLPSFSMHLLWSEASHLDEAQSWFRRELSTVAKTLISPPKLG
jgi:DNA-binding transcriptional LysR family regulator